MNDGRYTLQDTIDLFCEHLAANGRSPETISTYQRRSGRFFATSPAGPDTPINQLTPELLDNWAAAIHALPLATLGGDS